MSQVDLVWTARLESHLGSFKAELLRSRTQQAMSDKRALAGLNAVTAMIVTFLPEREAVNYSNNHACNMNAAPV